MQPAGPTWTLFPNADQQAFASFQAASLLIFTIFLSITKKPAALPAKMRSRGVYERARASTCVCVCVCVCARARVCVRETVCASAWVHARVNVCLNFWHRLLYTCTLFFIFVLYKHFSWHRAHWARLHVAGVSQLNLPIPFSPIFVCPANQNLSSIIFTHQLLPTHLQFSGLDCPFCPHRPFTYISLFDKSSFCHFSFPLRSTRDPARWPRAATRVVGGWDPGDWGYCWAAALQCQHITLARTSAGREARKARPDQSVGGTPPMGVFHHGQSGGFNPWAYFIHSPDVTGYPARNWHPLVGLGGGWGVDKMNWHEPYYGPPKYQKHVERIRTLTLSRTMR